MKPLGIELAEWVLMSEAIDLEVAQTIRRSVAELVASQHNLCPETGVMQRRLIWQLGSFVGAEKKSVLLGLILRLERALLAGDENSMALVKSEFLVELKTAVESHIQ
jgi:hypothetical protein